MFDPFRDFEERGYLRNFAREKDRDIVERVQHDHFLANYPAAMQVLSRTREITYWQFLRVHETLFKDFYPWAGQDRRTTAPDLAIDKAGVEFCNPAMMQRAVEHALELVQKGRMASNPGQVMGLFAFAHPFLDGNGRTILLVHGELCFRAGMSIRWDKTDKTAYLTALTHEINDPHGGHLDRYLQDFIGPQIPRTKWREMISHLPGLDGTGLPAPEVAGSFSDPAVAERYREFERRRNYELGPASTSKKPTSPGL